MRLEKGEELMAALKALMAREHVQGGSLTGLGAAERAVLASYCLGERKYHEFTYTGDLEVAGLTGTLAWKGEEPAPHVHCTLGDEKLHAHAGHVMSLTVGASLEIVVREIYRRLERKDEPSVGLPLLQL
jgi:hypothetical protein